MVDRCPASDLEVHAGGPGPAGARLRAPARRGRSPPSQVELLAPHELHALRARIARGRSSGPQTVGKVIVAGGGPLARRAARSRFQTIPGYELEGDPVAGFGTIGRLTLGDGVSVDLTELPGDSHHRPLWRPFASGAVGALVLLPAEDSEPLLVELARVLRLPVVILRAQRGAGPQRGQRRPRHRLRGERRGRRAARAPGRGGGEGDGVAGVVPEVLTRARPRRPPFRPAAGRGPSRETDWPRPAPACTGAARGSTRRRTGPARRCDPRP